jgi:hypothetical protein
VHLLLKNAHCVDIDFYVSTRKLDKASHKRKRVCCFSRDDSNRTHNNQPDVKTVLETEEKRADILEEDTAICISIHF